jgi:deoxyribonuclease V
MTSFPCGESRFDVPESHEERVALQREIADRAAWRSSGEDGLGTDAVAVGVDQSFRDDEAVSAAVAMRGGDVVERSVASAPLPMPYVPGLLAYREGPAICAALDGLGVEPDVVLFDGSGRIHYRQAGIATHVGVLRDVRSIGVAKNLLCGSSRTSLDVPLDPGDRVAIEADDEVEAPAGTVIGYAYQSRQYDETASQWINPLYVSPGHRIDADRAIDIVAEHCATHKLPEPIRRADAVVADRTG